MKASELMIGDWVYIKEHPMKQEAKKVTGNHFVRSLCEFEPISLTAEILKANEWKFYMTAWYWHREEEVFAVTHEERIRENTLPFMVCIDAP